MRLNDFAHLPVSNSSLTFPDGSQLQSSKGKTQDADAKIAALGFVSVKLATLNEPPIESFDEFADGMHAVPGTKFTESSIVIVTRIVVESSTMIPLHAMIPPLQVSNSPSSLNHFLPSE